MIDHRRIRGVRDDGHPQARTRQNVCVSDHSRSASAAGLPGDVVLLLHKPNGVRYASASPGVAAAAAELGELVLRHHIAVEGKKMRVIDPTSGGVAWIDDVLAALMRKSGPRGRPVTMSSWLNGRSSAFKVHRHGLALHGLLTYERRTFLGFIPDHRYYADPMVRESLIAELGRVARVEQAIDSRLALLTAIAHATGLSRALGFGPQERRMMKSIAKGEHLGGAVTDAIAATTAAIAGAAAASGGGGGGDGGGGGGGG